MMGENFYFSEQQWRTIRAWCREYYDIWDETPELIHDAATRKKLTKRMTDRGIRPLRGLSPLPHQIDECMRLIGPTIRGA